MIELIVQRYRKELTRYVLLHMHRGKADAEDIVQEVFFALYKKQNISVDENIRAWLYETARFKIMEYNRNNPQFDEVTDEISAPDDGFPDDISGSIFEGVSDEEYALLKSYFMGEDKNAPSSSPDTPSMLTNRISSTPLPLISSKICIQ